MNAEQFDPSASWVGQAYIDGALTPEEEVAYLAGPYSPIPNYDGSATGRLLAQIRLAIDTMKDTYDLMYRVFGWFVELDRQLTEGGELPVAWSDTSNTADMDDGREGDDR